MRSAFLHSLSFASVLFAATDIASGAVLYDGTGSPAAGNADVGEGDWAAVSFFADKAYTLESVTAVLIGSIDEAKLHIYDNVTLSGQNIPGNELQTLTKVADDFERVTFKPGTSNPPFILQENTRYWFRIDSTARFLGWIYGSGALTPDALWVNSSGEHGMTAPYLIRIEGIPIGDQPPNPVPLPTSWILMSFALFGLISSARRHNEV